MLRLVACYTVLSWFLEFSIGKNAEVSIRRIKYKLLLFFMFYSPVMYTLAGFFYWRNSSERKY